MTSCSRTAAAILVAATTALAACASADVPLSRTELRAGNHRFGVEIAATPAQRARGLMGRTQLDDDAGMLFVFEQADRHCFWMKDTPLPLSIAFLADDGTVVGMADMQPFTTVPHCAPVPVRHALEVRQGALENRGIAHGTRFSGGPLGAAGNGATRRQA